MADHIENEFNAWCGDYAANYSPPPQPPPTNPEDPPTPTPGLGFGAFANSPAPFMRYFGEGYRTYSTLDSQRFGRFGTPPTNSGRACFATQGLEFMNLVTSFESVTNVPALSPLKGKGKTKAKAKAKPKGKASEDDTDDTPTNRLPIAYSPEETTVVAWCWSAVSQDLRMGHSNFGSESSNFTIKQSQRM